MKLLFAIISIFILITPNPPRENHRERVAGVVSAEAARKMGDSLADSFGLVIGAIGALNCVVATD